MSRRKGEEKKPRRPKGEGTVFQRKSDGRWVAQYPDEATGKRRMLYANSEREAWQKLEKALLGDLPPVERLTVADFLDEYQRVRDIDGKANTKQNIDTVVRLYLRPRMGHLKLISVTQRHIQDLVTLWTKRLKPTTVHTYYANTCGVFTHARKIGLIERSPCRDIVLPVIKRPKRQTISPAQIKQLLAVLKDDWFKVFLILALATGMRKGELLALRWKDVDLVAGGLRVVRNVVQLPGPTFVVDEPKSEASIRPIIIQSFALDRLKKHRIEQVEQRLKAGDAWEEHDLVFCRHDGSFIRAQAPNQKLHAGLKRAGLLSIGMTPHGCRHTLASQMLGEKINLKVVQEVLGHNRIEMTLNIYSHCLPGEHEEAMAQMNDVLWDEGQIEA